MGPGAKAETSIGETRINCGVVVSVLLKLSLLGCRNESRRMVSKLGRIILSPRKEYHRFGKKDEMLIGSDRCLSSVPLSDLNNKEKVDTLQELLHN